MSDMHEFRSKMRAWFRICQYVYILRDESHIWVVLKMGDPDLGGSIRAGPDLCDQRIPCPNIGGWLTPSPEYWWPADPQPRIWVAG